MSTPRRLWIGLVILLAPATAAAAPATATAMPNGYFVDSVQAFAPRPVSVNDTTSEYSISIHRVFPNPDAERLLGIAEALYPPRDLLITIALAQGREMGPDTSGVPLWWCDGIDARRVPFAVTEGAVAHYMKLTELFRERDFHAAGSRPIFQSGLRYRAMIAFRDSFTLGSTPYRDVYVAHLRLDWTYDDGTFLSVVDAQRVVVLKPKGDILAVAGDGEADEKVYISTRRGIGRQELLLR